jgi:hypothetical protein
MSLLTELAGIYEVHARPAPRSQGEHGGPNHAISVLYRPTSIDRPSPGFPMREGM